jgi:uncharacterized membrane protein (UPF0127 family)
VKKYPHNSIVCFVAIIFTTLFSLQACAQNDNTADLVKSGQADIKQVIINTSDELTEEELALLADDSHINISFANKSLQVEFADSFEERALGLMYRKRLCEDCGMLFQFDVERMASIWMKNTFVPLDLAYITVDGKIIDIMQLEPLDLTSVKSSKQVLYALEMNQGWFAKNKIKVGDKISIEGRVKQPSFK